MYTFRSHIFLLLLPAFYYVSCRKSSFLDTKPNQALVVPTSITDCQALLDNDEVMNGFGNSGYPSLGETGSDDYYTSNALYAYYDQTDQNACIWAQQVYGSGTEVEDWDLPYRTVFYSNEVLQVLATITPTSDQQAAWNMAKGSALFFRAFAFYELSQIFAPAYDSITASSDLGIPQPLSPDVNDKIFRTTVQQTYNQILQDLAAATPFLPSLPQGYPTRPCRAAVYGLLARVYLSARAYSQAGAYADSCLQLQNSLMNYDTVTQALFPFNRWNAEVIFSAEYYKMTGPASTGLSLTDSNLYQSYQPGDLRQSLFFKYGNYFFGRYDQQGYFFCGLATDELFLTRAECRARAGDIPDAMADLNTLLQARWTNGAFIPLTAATAEDALQQILTERRKELLYRGLRWTDLRRLNKESGRAITLTRIVNGQTYTLPPNDPRYIYPIPENVLAANPGMAPNPR